MDDGFQEKKKPLKSWDKDRGGNHGKFNSNDEHQKPKGIKAQNPKRSNDASGGSQRPTRETGSNVGSRGKATITQRSKGDKSAKVGPFAVFSLANQEASSSTDWLNLSSKKRRMRFEDWDKPSGPSLGPLKIWSHPNRDTTETLVFGDKPKTGNVMEDSQARSQNGKDTQGKKGGVTTPGGE